MSSPAKPTNIYELKQVLRPRLYNVLDEIHKNDNNTILNYTTTIDDFFKSGYSLSITESELSKIKTQIDIVKKYDESRNKIKNDYVEACKQYVDKAKAIFEGLDTLITSNIIIDDSVYVDIKKQIQGPVELVKQEINKLIVRSSSALSDDETELNDLLDRLVKILDGMVQNIIDIIKQTMNEKFNIEFYKLVFQLNPSMNPGIIKMLNIGLVPRISIDIDLQTKTFLDLLESKKLDNNKIIADQSPISNSFNILAEALKQTLTEGGNIFNQLVNIIREKITIINEKINKEVVALGAVPEMAEDAPESGTEVGGGGGNGNTSTFATLATYPISNKSHKNRNNRNSKGKGKGKGRKPNATKKNNRR
uniref:Uncharacterized protein n=1 Tax=viral metagenome TaxID=1070528 RepID=A0A6C0EW74_9ZZZZ